MMEQSHILFIHGSGGDKSQTFKARHLRSIFPLMVTPDFDGELLQRMDQLSAILNQGMDWILIGSSLGGLMAALFTAHHPTRIRKLILLAPALVLPDFADHLPPPISTPTVLIHGTRDELLDLALVRKLAQQVFTNLRVIIVDDDHRLHKTAQQLDWKDLLADD